MKEVLKDILTENSNRQLGEELVLRNTKLHVDLPKIQAVLGPRRVGKTSTMNLYMQERITSKRVSPSQLIYFNFEDEGVSLFRAARFDPSVLERITSRSQFGGLLLFL